MSLEKELDVRSGSKCELCGSTDDLVIYNIPPHENKNADNNILTCSVCNSQINDPETMDPNHWRCLNDSMWSTTPGVQVVAWRMLNRLIAEGWPQDLLDMMYMDEDTTEWAKATGEDANAEAVAKHVDCNGIELFPGDSVTLTKDLNVKGATFTAKRGTPIRNIILVHDNHEHIEGKVDGQKIVILTKFVKK